MNVPFKKSLFQMMAVIGLSIYGVGLEAASFDCAKAATPMERLICSNDSVSQLDEDLGQAYKEALVKYADKKDMLVRQQRNWIKWIRSQCTDPSCLVTLYEARIGEIADGDNVAALNGPDKPNFVLTKGRGTPVCDEYLKVLNSAPRDELRACKLPDLSNSKIKPVEFKPLTGKKLMAVDRLIYEQVYKADWTKAWPEREKEYLSGYRKMAEAFWDLDKDGESDQIIRESSPQYRCVLLGNENSSELRNVLKRKWKFYSHEEQINIALDSGYDNSYKLIKNGIVSFVDAENFVFFEGNYLSIDQVELVRAKTSNDWASRDWVQIWGVKSERDDDIRNYGLTPSKCNFWLNR